MFIASYGWDHPGWCGSYYPDDLPADWRLAYYANEFRAVVVPAARWRAVDQDTVAQWLADTGTEFRFLLEADGASEAPAALVQALGTRCAGVVDGAAVWWTGAADARALRHIIEGLPADGVLVVTGEPPSIAVLRTAQTITQLLGR